MAQLPSHAARLMRPRSLLFVANRVSAYAQAAASRADGVILDMEDAVAWEHKDATRELMCRHVPLLFHEQQRVMVRVNSLADAACAAKDISVLSAALGPRLGTLLLPMVEDVDDVLQYEAMLRSAQQQQAHQHHVTLACLIETPKALVNAYDLLSCSPLVSHAVLGTADLAATMTTPETDILVDASREFLGIAAKAAGVHAVDKVHTLLDDHAGFASSCKVAAELGFGGKLLVHPNQIPLAHRHFSPSPLEVSTAAETLQQLDAAEGSTKVWREHHHTSRKFLGPPHRALASHVLQTSKFYNCSGDWTVGPGETKASVVKHSGGLDFENAAIGRVIPSEHSFTVTEALLQQWQSALFEGGFGPSLNAEMAKALGFSNLLVPPSLLSALAISLMVSRLTEPAIVHLGVYDAQQVEAVYAGDTLRATAEIVGAKTTSAGHIIIDTIHRLHNQHKQTVFQLFKRSMFDAQPAPKLRLSPTLPPVHVHAPGPHAEEPPFMQATQALTWEAATAATGITPDDMPALQPGSVLVHRMVKHFGVSETLGLCNALRLTNRHHLDFSKYDLSDILVPGPVGAGAALANTGLELGTCLAHTIVHQVMLNKVNPGATMQSMTLVVDVQPVANNQDLEVVHLVTLGVINQDLDVLLNSVELPLGLFHASTPPKPAAFEATCLAHCPLLYRQVANHTVWQVVRLRPRAE